MLELALGCQPGDPAVRRGPDGSVRTAIDIVHLVVRKAQRIVRAEVLVILVDAVSVEPAGGGDPDMAVVILGEGVHPLVGEPVGNDDGPGRLGNGRRATLATCEDGQQEDISKKFVFHRCWFVLVLVKIVIFEQIERSLNKCAGTKYGYENY